MGISSIGAITFLPLRSLVFFLPLPSFGHSPLFNFFYIFFFQKLLSLFIFSVPICFHGWSISSSCSVHCLCHLLFSFCVFEKAMSLSLCLPGSDIGFDGPLISSSLLSFLYLCQIFTRYEILSAQ